MKYLRTYNESTGTPKVSLQKFINNLNDGFQEVRYYTNPDGSIDFDGDLVMRVYTFDELDFRIESVQGNFEIANERITSLIGSPRYVKGNFIMLGMRQITSLVGGPEELGGGLVLRGPSISNLIGAPHKVDSIDAAYTPITSLQGIPKIIEDGFFFQGCSKLWNPEGLRDCQVGRRIGGEFKNTPLSPLWIMFGSLEAFQESLDYNYITGNTDQPALDLFRFEEALREFDINLESYLNGPKKDGRVPITDKNLGKYIFLNGEGDRVDIWGNIIEF